MTTVDLGIEHLSDAVVIGQGGFATVYAATNDLLGTRVAVKVLAPLSTDADRRRFERECRVMGRVSAHPSVVTVHHAGYSAHGRPYLVMELMDGGSLADRLRDSGPLGWEEAVDHAIAVADALAHAHAAGILHRDVKPENILVGAGQPRLTDFGIAYLRDATSATSTKISASWLHSPPETFSNQRDERSDVYSLGSTLYQLLTGHAPFWREEEESLNPLLYRLMNEPAPPLPADIGPAALDAVLQRCLAKEPSARPPSAAAYAAELRAVRAVGAVGDGVPVVQPVTAAVGDLPSAETVAVPAVPAVPAETVAVPADPAAQAVPPSQSATVPARPDPTQHSPGGAIGGAESDRPLTSLPTPPGRRRLVLAGAAGLGVLAAVIVGLMLTLGGGGDSPFSETANGVLVFGGHSDGVVGLARLDDGRLVSAANDSTTQIWDPDRTEVDPIVLEGHEGFVRAVAVLGPDRIVSASADGTARVWDLADPAQPLTVFDGHGAEVASVAALADGSVASAGEDGTVQVWDAESASVRAELDVGGAVRVVIALDTGGLVAAGTGGDIERWDDPISGDEPTAVYPGHDGSVNGLAVLEGERLVSVGDDGAVRLWSLGGDTEPLSEHQHDEPVDAVAVLADGRIIYADRSGTVATWDPLTGDSDAVAELSSRVRALVTLPDGRVAAGTAGGDVRLWTP